MLSEGSGYVSCNWSCIRTSSLPSGRSAVQPLFLLVQQDWEQQEVTSPREGTREGTREGPG